LLPTFVISRRGGQREEGMVEVIGDIIFDITNDLSDRDNKL
jgi:hypothetical protein